MRSGSDLAHRASTTSGPFQHWIKFSHPTCRKSGGGFYTLDGTPRGSQLRGVEPYHAPQITMTADSRAVRRPGDTRCRRSVRRTGRSASTPGRREIRLAPPLGSQVPTRSTPCAVELVRQGFGIYYETRAGGERGRRRRRSATALSRLWHTGRLPTSSRCGSG